MLALPVRSCQALALRESGIPFRHLSLTCNDGGDDGDDDGDDDGGCGINEYGDDVVSNYKRKHSGRPF